jgi:GntR family transcriptional repressor for pyruvate dehydrogenase complex
MGVSMKNQSVDFGTYGRENLSEKIADNILNLIRERKLLPGDKLPPERELAEQMGVSRPSVREALRALSIMKVIDHRQGSGTYITSLEPNYLIEHLDFVFALEDSTYLDLLEARKVIESGIAELAAQRITDLEIHELNKFQEESINSVNNNEEFLKADLEIHDVICRASRNSILQRTMASLVKISIHSRRRTVQIGEVRSQTIIDHEKIIKSITARDSIAARQAMLDHLNHVEKGLKSVLSTKNSGQSSI